MRLYLIIVSFFLVFSDLSHSDNKFKNFFSSMFGKKENTPPSGPNLSYEEVKLLEKKGATSIIPLKTPFEIEFAYKAADGEQRDATFAVADGLNTPETGSMFLVDYGNNTDSKHPSKRPGWGRHIQLYFKIIENGKTTFKAIKFGDDQEVEHLATSYGNINKYKENSTPISSKDYKESEEAKHLEEYTIVPPIEEQKKAIAENSQSFTKAQVLKPSIRPSKGLAGTFDCDANRELVDSLLGSSDPEQKKCFLEGLKKQNIILDQGHLGGKGLEDSRSMVLKDKWAQNKSDKYITSAEKMAKVKAKKNECSGRWTGSNSCKNKDEESIAYREGQAVMAMSIRARQMMECFEEDLIAETKNTSYRNTISRNLFFTRESPYHSYNSRGQLKAVTPGTAKSYNFQYRKDYIRFLVKQKKIKKPVLISVHTNAHDGKVNYPVMIHPKASSSGYKCDWKSGGKAYKQSVQLCKNFVEPMNKKLFGSNIDITELNKGRVKYKNRAEYFNFTESKTDYRPKSKNSSFFLLGMEDLGIGTLLAEVMFHDAMALELITNRPLKVRTNKASGEQLLSMSPAIQYGAEALVSGIANHLGCWNKDQPYLVDTQKGNISPRKHSGRDI